VEPYGGLDVASRPRLVLGPGVYTARLPAVAPVGHWGRKSCARAVQTNGNGNVKPIRILCLLYQLWDHATVLLLSLESFARANTRKIWRIDNVLKQLVKHILLSSLWILNLYFISLVLNQPLTKYQEGN